jgi:hypothetical protein
MCGMAGLQICVVCSEGRRVHVLGKYRESAELRRKPHNTRQGEFPFTVQVTVVYVLRTAYVPQVTVVYVLCTALVYLPHWCTYYVLCTVGMHVEQQYRTHV